MITISLFDRYSMIVCDIDIWSYMSLSFSGSFDSLASSSSKFCSILSIEKSGVDIRLATFSTAYKNRNITYRLDFPKYLYEPEFSGVYIGKLYNIMSPSGR